MSMCPVADGRAMARPGNVARANVDVMCRGSYAEVAR